MILREALERSGAKKQLAPCGSKRRANSKNQQQQQRGAERTAVSRAQLSPSRVRAATHAIGRSSHPARLESMACSNIRFIGAADRFRSHKSTNPFIVRIVHLLYHLTNLNQSQSLKLARRVDSNSWYELSCVTEFNVTPVHPTDCGWMTRRLTSLGITPPAIAPIKQL